eukprot:TRINITY_DN64222_c0_g1_i2.p2 TRINITY_DN64222_c0_g1~~TRINITY_DN64222_c0_g1_i2.p2  ORF type:complete len:156 (+),score=17.67 TRINITY_DN64222_c0_g1_i2:34-501(+)
MGGPGFCDGKSHSQMDNFLQRKFTLDGLEWISPEQFFQAQKFPPNSAQWNAVRAEKDGNGCWSLGQQPGIRADWEQVKVDMMYKGNVAKFEQNEDLKQHLTSTTGAITCGGFPFWAKWNAIILMRIREELRSPEQQNKEVLADMVAQMDAYRQQK